MRYRYQSPVLHGPWRAAREAAIEDALRVRQAFRDRDGRLVWQEGAGLEEDAGTAPTELTGPIA
jgi:hypothetical protein